MVPAPLRRGIIVSCQPTGTSVWRKPEHIVALATAAQRGGAVAVRVDGPEAVRACKAVTSLPIIAIHTDAGPDRTVAITPTVQHALALIDAGADIVALDATMSARQHDGQDIGEMVSYIRRKTGVPVMADVSTVADGLNAADAGVLLVGSSTTGYGHPDTTTLPNLRLVEDLVGVLEVPVIAERGYSTLEHVRTAFELGALAVVVGSAITDPAFITARFRDVAEAPATTARTRPGDYT